MNLKKLLVIIFLFYFFTLLQNSFFTHFDAFGGALNLVFILFFLVAFFEEESRYLIVFLAAAAGFFLDIFSYSYIGPSIVLLIIIGLLLKSAQSSLKNRKDSHPFIYFLPLFIVFLLAYDLLMDLYFHFLGLDKIAITTGVKIIFSLICNSLVASVLFYFYKKISLFYKKK